MENKETVSRNKKGAEIVWWIILTMLVGTVIAKTILNRELDFTILAILFAFAPQPFKERGCFEKNKTVLIISVALAVISLGLAFTQVTIQI